MQMDRQTDGHTDRRANGGTDRDYVTTVVTKNKYKKFLNCTVRASLH